MADRTGIEWTDATWNPVRGCTRVSEGCRHCYAETTAVRFARAGQPFHSFADPARSGSKWTGQVALVPHLIDLPLRWRRPRRIFANSMSDLFHEALAAEEIATIYAVAVAAVHLRGHTIQILTKRPDRMRELLHTEAFWHQVNAEAGMHILANTDPLDRRRGDARATLQDYGADKPPPGIWLGTSVEDQPTADDRIPALETTPAALRFISAEPLLSGIDIYAHLAARKLAAEPFVDWVIVGGESGAGARPMHPDWVRSLRDQCVAAGVPYFFKQWGEWAPDSIAGPMLKFAKDPDEELHGWPYDEHTDSWRIGKKVAGAMLDGREWREMPR